VQRAHVIVLVVLVSAGAATSASAQLENFKCYKARDLSAPRFQSTTVDLADQFPNDGTFAIRKPTMFCTPVDLNAGGVDNTLDHFTCYKIKGPMLAQADRPNVEVMNDLGALQLQAKKPRVLCVPSTETVLP
jgi:hypothetical protein